MLYRAFKRLHVNKEVEFEAVNLDQAYINAKKLLGLKSLGEAYSKPFCYVERVLPPQLVGNQIKVVQIFGVDVYFDFKKQSIEFKNCDSSCRNEQISEIKETRQYKEMEKKLNDYVDYINLGNPSK